MTDEQALNQMQAQTWKNMAGDQTPEQFMAYSGCVGPFAQAQALAQFLPNVPEFQQQTLRAQVLITAHMAAYLAAYLAAQLPQEVYLIEYPEGEEYPDVYRDAEDAHAAFIELQKEHADPDGESTDNWTESQYMSFDDTRGLMFCLFKVTVA